MTQLRAKDAAEWSLEYWLSFLKALSHSPGEEVKKTYMKLNGPLELSKMQIFILPVQLSVLSLMCRVLV